MRGYMLDTNIFNAIKDGDIDIEAIFSGLPIFVTHVQLDEIRATRNEVRRAQLEDVVREVPHQELQTTSIVWGVSRWDRARWSNGVLFQELRERLDALNSGKGNNSKDILIAETAIQGGLTLVTNDRDLTRVTAEFGGAVCSLHQLVGLLLP